MKLLTKALLAKLPKLKSTENDKDPKVVVKFFDPTGSWTWYATEYDSEQRLFYGYVRGMESEWGYFGLAELESVKGRFGLAIERDRHWDSVTPISQVLSGAKR